MQSFSIFLFQSPVSQRWGSRFRLKDTLPGPWQGDLYSGGLVQPLSGPRPLLSTLHKRHMVRSQLSYVPRSWIGPLALPDPPSPSATLTCSLLLHLLSCSPVPSFLRCGHTLLPQAVSSLSSLQTINHLQPYPCSPGHLQEEEGEFADSHSCASYWRCLVEGSIVNLVTQHSQSTSTAFSSHCLGLESPRTIS